MPAKRKHERIQCIHFVWMCTTRNRMWYADGRSNNPGAGRHSLGTTNRDEAMRRLAELDRCQAVAHGLIPPTLVGEAARSTVLDLQTGRELYEGHIKGPRITGGVRKSTQKRYRTVFDKFLSFAKTQNLTAWNHVTSRVLSQYAEHLASIGRHDKTILNELTTLKQTVRWFIKEGHLSGVESIVLKLKKVVSTPAYCYRTVEIEAMINHCQKKSGLKWLSDVIIALTCTGLRISELVSLRWPDIDLNSGILSLTDESGSNQKGQNNRRELKSGRGRSFPIHRDLIVVLEKLPKTGPHVFRGPRGGRLKPDTVRRLFVANVIHPLKLAFTISDRAKGFESGRLHSFRHYFCSTCANDGIPERVVMNWLGHSDSAMIKHYYHLHDEESRRRMDQIEFLGKAAGRSGGKAKVVVKGRPLRLRKSRVNHNKKPR